MFIPIRSERHYLWRAVDQDGKVLDILLQNRRNTRTEKRSLRVLLKGLCYAPNKVVTDKPRRYGAAHAEVNGYLLKPYSAQVLTQQLRKILPSPASIHTTRSGQHYF